MNIEKRWKGTGNLWSKKWKSFGKGWYGDSERHRRAKLYGRAGGRYFAAKAKAATKAKPREIPLTKMKEPYQIVLKDFVTKDTKKNKDTKCEE